MEENKKEKLNNKNEWLKLKWVEGRTKSEKVLSNIDKQDPQYLSYFYYRVWNEQRTREEEKANLKWKGKILSSLQGFSSSSLLSMAVDVAIQLAHRAVVGLSECDDSWITIKSIFFDFDYRFFRCLSPLLLNISVATTKLKLLWDVRCEHHYIDERT